MNREEVAAESTRRMIAGLGAMERGEWNGARICFEDAARMREGLPWRDDPESAWMLAAAWINRGDVMRRSGNPEWREESVISFDRGIEAMGFVPLEGNPAVVERLILAWINRGTACGEDGDFDEAVAGFSEADRLFGVWGMGVTPERRFLAAMMRVNRARAFVVEGRATDAWEDAKEAARILNRLETSGPVAAAGIKARSIGCRALAMMLEEPGGVERAGDWIAEATDAAEEALALVKISGFRDAWVGDLVRYGARIYRACQPQFLGEFLTEWLAGDGPLAGDLELIEEMRGVIRLAQLEVERKVLLAPQETEFVEKQIGILKSLQEGLAGLR